MKLPVPSNYRDGSKISSKKELIEKYRSTAEPFVEKAREAFSDIKNEFYQMVEKNDPYSYGEAKALMEDSEKKFKTILNSYEDLCGETDWEWARATYLRITGYATRLEGRVKACQSLHARSLK